MTQSMEIIILQREDVFDVSRILARALPTACLEAPESPLLVSVRGTMGSGKKIITDAMREELMGSTALSGFRGAEGKDEFWTGIVNGKPFELDYLDIMWTYSYATPALNADYRGPDLKDEEKENIFFGLRSHGGLTIIQNRLDPATSGFDVWMEALYGKIVRREDLPRAIYSGIADAFKMASDPARKPKSWARYLEMTVSDARLLAHAPFCVALEAFAETSREIVSRIRAGEKEVEPGLYRRNAGLAGLAP